MGLFGNKDKDVGPDDDGAGKTSSTPVEPVRGGRNRGGNDDNDDGDAPGTPGMKARMAKFGARVKEKVGDGVDVLPDKWQDRLQRLALESEELKDKLKEMADRQAEVVRHAVANKINEALDRALDRAGDVLADKIKDDTMPIFVQDAVDATVKDVMPDVKREIMEAVESKLRKTEAHDPGTRPRNPLLMIRAWVLYTLYPNDRTIWQKLRNPFWYLLLIIMAFPRWGVHQAAFLLLLIFRDKSDEFQLVDYIVGFKGVQFVAIGVIPSIVGAYQLYFCTTSTDDEACESDAPQLAFWELAFFVSQILLMWGAFALLPYAEKRGGVRFKHHRRSQLFDPPSQPGCCGKPKYKGRGGRIAAWIWYDTAMFVVCVGLIVGAILSDRVVFDEHDELYWKSRAAFYWTRVLYGLLSFPWILFKMPFIFTLFTHARPTAYNRNGKTMPVSKIRKGAIIDETVQAVASG
jgi:hypothetical protein